MTPCAPVAEFTENFDSADALPNCWMKCGDSGGVTVGSYGVYAKGTRSLKLFSGSSTNQRIVAMPAVSGTKKLKFKAMAEVPGSGIWITNASLEIGYLKDINNPSSFVMIDKVDVITEFVDLAFKDYEFELTPEPVSQVLAFRHSGNVTSAIYIDNVQWGTDLGVESIDNSNFSYYPNPVKDMLNLSYDSQNITAVSVFNLIGQEVIVKAVNANQTAVDMSNLPNGTYLVKVTSENQVKNIKVIKQ